MSAGWLLDHCAAIPKQKWPELSASPRCRLTRNEPALSTTWPGSRNSQWHERPRLVPGLFPQPTNFDGQTPIPSESNPPLPGLYRRTEPCISRWRTRRNLGCLQRSPSHRASRCRWVGARTLCHDLRLLQYSVGRSSNRFPDGPGTGSRRARHQKHNAAPRPKLDGPPPQHPRTPQTLSAAALLRTPPPATDPPARRKCSPSNLCSSAPATSTRQKSRGPPPQAQERQLRPTGLVTVSRITRLYGVFDLSGTAVLLDRLDALLCRRLRSIHFALADDLLIGSLRNEVGLVRG
jgi:hypothetical protein